MKKHEGRKEGVGENKGIERRGWSCTRRRKSRDFCSEWFRMKEHEGRERRGGVEIGFV
jgi:hypothetical protein